MSQRFVLLVEGHTEHHSVAAFLKKWLDARLAAQGQQPVGIQPVRFDGWQDVIDDAPKRARQYLDKAKNRAEVIAVIGLIDLYGPTFYPKHLTTVQEKYEWAKADIEAKVNHPKFRQFFAVHETEAWLLSDIDRFPTDVRKMLATKVARPETINFDEPPAKFLDRVYMSVRKRHYDKVAEGRNHFPHLNPEVVAGKCPYLQAMLDDLLALVREARQENPQENGVVLP